MRPRAAFLVLLAATGCAGSQGMYHWGDYDAALYQHYKTPAEREAWVASLKTTLVEAEQQGRRLPPGLCAEYGYALLEEGSSREAVSWFEKEKAKWPESTLLMDKMIRNAGRRPVKPAAAKGPATQLERKP